MQKRLDQEGENGVERITGAVDGAERIGGGVNGMARITGGANAMERITSRTNSLIAHIRRLAASGSSRREAGLFVCDGPKLLEEALRWNGGIQALILSEGLSPETVLPYYPKSLLWERLKSVRVVSVPADLMRAVSPSKTPQGVLCVCAIPDQAPPDPLPGRCYLVLDGVQDPGNVGTMLRTADAFGADGVFLLPDCADLYHPKTVRASMGAVFRLPAWTCGIEFLRDLLERSRMPLYGAALREDAEDLRKIDLSRFAAAIGSEGRGLSPEVLSLCGQTIRIPMRARCESLNAAMAAGVILWEAARETLFDEK